MVREPLEAFRMISLPMTKPSTNAVTTLGGLIKKMICPCEEVCRPSLPRIAYVDEIDGLCNLTGRGQLPVFHSKEIFLQ